MDQGGRVFCSENELKGDIVVFQADNDFIEPNKCLLMVVVVIRLSIFL